MPSNQSPQTLRSMAGLCTPDPSISGASLLVVDAQRAYSIDGALPLDGIERASARVVELVDRARNAGAPVIHVAHTGGPGSPFDPLDGGRFLPGLEPRDGEKIVNKTLPNSFAGTELLAHLESASRRPLIIAGFMTHMCVSSTARAALDLGFETTIVSDATATRDLAGADGQVVPARIVQSAALAALADRFGAVAVSDQLPD